MKELFLLRSLVTEIAVGFIQLSLPPRKRRMQILVNKFCLILELKNRFQPSISPGTRRGSALGVTRGHLQLWRRWDPEGTGQSHPCSPWPPPAVPRWGRSRRIPALDSSLLLIPG